MSTFISLKKLENDQCIKHIGRLLGRQGQYKIQAMELILVFGFCLWRSFQVLGFFFKKNLSG